MELLALNLAQRWLTGAVERIVELLSAEPREHHEQGGARGDPEALAKEVERVWGEVQEGLARATAAVSPPSLPPRPFGPPFGISLRPPKQPMTPNDLPLLVFRPPCTSQWV